MLELAAPVYLGWSLGANDASNVFGTAVTSEMLRFRTAVILAAVFVLIGAIAEGEAGMATLSGLSRFDTTSAVLASLGAALAVTVLTLLKLPVSTSQAVVGAIIGVGVWRGGVDTSNLGKVVACWIGTPLGAMVVAVAVYLLLAPVFNRLADRIVRYDLVLRVSLVLAGCYGAYALGANNVANVTGIFVGAGILSPLAAAILGGASIGFGVLTFSRRVMVTVGRGIIRLNAFGALVVVLSESITVHFYAMVGVPVSTSQAVVGAVIGVGVLKSAQTIRARPVLGIISGWLATPLLAAACAMLLYVIAHLRFVG